MLEILCIVMLIIAFVKPDSLLAKNVKEKANGEEKTRLIKNLRKIWVTILIVIETAALTRRFLEADFAFVFFIALAVELILLFVIALPSIKENRKILKNLK